MAARRGCTRRRCTAISRASGLGRFQSCPRWRPDTGKSAATTSMLGSASPMGGMIAPPEQDQLARFDGVERAVHWTNATLFLVLLGTGAALYVGPISTLVGRRELMKT